MEVYYNETSIAPEMSIANQYSFKFAAEIFEHRKDVRRKCKTYVKLVHRTISG